MPSLSHEYSWCDTLSWTWLMLHIHKDCTYSLLVCCELPLSERSNSASEMLCTHMNHTLNYYYAFPGDDPLSIFQEWLKIHTGYI